MCPYVQGMLRPSFAPLLFVFATSSLAASLTTGCYVHHRDVYVEPRHEVVVHDDHHDHDHDHDHHDHDDHH